MRNPQHAAVLEHFDITSLFTTPDALKYAEVTAKGTTVASIAFSSVTGAKASQLLDDLQLTETDGFAEAPFEIPAGWQPCGRR